MCSLVLTRGGLPIPEELSPRDATPDFVNFGEDVVLVKRRWGAGGVGIEWATMRYGMEIGEDRRSARTVDLDRADLVRDYNGSGMATHLCAVPMYGYRQFSASTWTKMPPGWAMGFYTPELDQFLLAVSVEGGNQRPVVADWKRRAVGCCPRSGSR